MKNNRGLTRPLAVAMWVASLFISATNAHSACVDLINSDSGSILTGHGGRFEFMTQQPTGTGVIDPFLRLQKNGVEHGYNTSGGDPQPPLDAKAGIWTHNLQMKDLNMVTVDGQNYYQFLLDINESVGHQNEFLSLDKLQIYTSSIGSQTVESFSASALYGQTLDLASSQLRYSLDSAGIDNCVMLDYSRNTGSGSGDMIAYIPASLFNDPTLTGETYIYLYSQFGATFSADYSLSADAGFEEWWVLQSQPIPEASTVFAGLFLLGGLGWFERSRIKALANRWLKRA